MNFEIQKALVGLIFTGVIGAIFKVYFDYKVKLMENIWEKRLDAYMKFVKLTSLFPKYPRQEVNWKQVYHLSENFRDWYFEGHGLLLSTKIRDSYFSLQDNIISITKEKINSVEKISDTEYEHLRKKCSLIRSLMAKELDSRENPFWHYFTKSPTA